MPNEISNGIGILEKVIEKYPELLFDVDDLVESASANNLSELEITFELIQKMVDWDRKNKRLKPHHFKMMYDLVDGRQELSSLNKRYCLLNYKFISKYGFKI